jgi:uncharacterized protein YuzE
MTESKIKLRVSADDPDVAYLQLPDHPGEGKYNIVGNQIRLVEIIEGYQGPDINLDFDKDGKLIGIEILA